jgi:hypothetical protein
MPSPPKDGREDEGNVSLSVEWARGRDTIDKCDERIHDIRKQGLTFLAGLLTAQAVVGVSSWLDAGTHREALSFTLLAFSLLVILATRLFEKQNQLLQAAAASRCLVIESFSAAELTDTITDRHLRQRWPLLTFLLYLSFGALVVVLYQALYGAGGLSALWVNGPILALFAGTLAVFSVIDLRPTSVRGLDWSLSQTTADPGDVIQVRVVNLDGRPRRLPSYPQLVDLELEASEGARDGEPAKGEAAAKWFENRWWRAVDAVPGKLELAIVVGSIATLLLGFDRFASGGLALWAVLAAVMVAAGLFLAIELVPLAVLRWPLGAVVVHALRPFLPEEAVHQVAQLRQLLVGSHEGLVILALLSLGVATVAAAVALGYRLTRHGTTGVDSSWPATWRWSSSSRVCFLPPLGSFVWTLQVPGGAKQLRIRVKDVARASMYFRKPIVVRQARP